MLGKAKEIRRQWGLLGVLPPLIRRLWIMAGQPYWAPKPSSFRMRMPKGDVEIRISPRRGGVVLEPSGTSSKG